MRTDKTQPIHGLDKIPIEGLLAFERVERGKDKSYIEELEDANVHLQAELKRLRLRVKYLENNPNRQITDLERKLHKAINGSKIDRKKIKAELYQTATLQDLVNYKYKAEKLIVKMRADIKRERNGKKDLIAQLANK